MSSSKVKHRYDVLIVGAGPAGSTLGYLLASQGIDVLVIEKETFPRSKLCGGGITWKTRMLLEELYRIPFVQIFPFKGCAEDFAIYEKRTLKVLQSSPEPFYFVDREAYDLKLVSLAEERFCRFLFGQRVIDLSLSDKKITIRSGETFQGQIIVGADGINSLIRKKTFPKVTFRRNLGLGFQVKVPVLQLKAVFQTQAPKFFFGYAKWGYGWVFPNNDHFVVGLWGLIRKNPRLRDSFVSFLRDVTELDVNQRSSFLSHMGPSGNFMEVPAADDVLLLGDAAGLSDPLTGEGIYYAHKSAELAAQTIREYFDSGQRQSLSGIYGPLLKPFIRELKIAKRFRDWTYSPLRHLGYRVLNPTTHYYKLAGVLHGTKTYSRLPFFFQWP